MTNGNSASEAPKQSEPSAGQGDPAAAAEVDGQQTAEPAAATPPQQRTWKMPKAPVTREHADKLGRVAVDVVKSTARFVADVARFVGRVLNQAWRAFEGVPTALKVFVVAGLFLLLGLAGAIALDSSLGLLCTLVVIPVCSITLGALGHRWYSGLAAEQQSELTDTGPAEPSTSDLQRSVEYVDNKLAVALKSFGTERHQQAVIALFQAKTAVELTLGTEQDTSTYGAFPLPVDDQDLRPRIRVGSSSKSLMRESNSLAAS
ncbi:MAG: hypothetical protein WBB00_07515 [Mycobacterium sp.]